MKNIEYLKVLKIAGIRPDYGERLCSLLGKETLDKLTKVGFHRSAIRPVLENAEAMQGGITDKNVNAVLNNQNLMSSIIKDYCQ